MERPVKDPSEFKAGITYVQCSRCDWWYPEGHGCPDHNPWKRCQKRAIIVHFREPNHGLETIRTREGKVVAASGHDYVIMGIEGEVYPIGKEIFEKTHTILDDTLIKLVERDTEISCLCGEDNWIIDSGDESLEDCDLMEKRLCNNCGREYETKYQLISFNEMSEVTGWKAIGRHKEPHQTEYSVDVVHVPSSVKEPKDDICPYCEMGELEPYSGRVYYGYRGDGIVGAKHIDLEDAQKCNHCGAYIWEEGI